MWHLRVGFGNPRVPGLRCRTTTPESEGAVRRSGAGRGLFEREDRVVGGLGASSAAQRGETLAWVRDVSLSKRGKWWSRDEAYGNDTYFRKRLYGPLFGLFVQHLPDLP